MSLEELMKRIEQSDKEEIIDVLDAAMKRKRELYPDWDIIYYAGKKGEKDEVDVIRSLLRKRE